MSAWRELKVDQRLPRDLNEAARDVWNDNAEFWDGKMGEGNAFHLQLNAPAVERLLQLQPGEHVLEFACGNGQFARRMAELGATVVATDFAAKMIEVARRRTAPRAEIAGRIDFRLLDATDEAAIAEFGVEAFDAAVCVMGMMDMAEIDPLLRGARRVLKRGGRFVFVLCHPCFNHTGMRMTMEEQFRDGAFVTERAIKVVTYKHNRPAQGVAIIGQPRLQWYFDRTLTELFGACFRAGFMLDGLEEPTFTSGQESERPFGWQAFSEIPPVLAARLRPA